MKSDVAASSTTARTIYDLARATGLSKTTVSSALSGNGRISPATRERVLEAARALNYEGNYYAQRLKRRCTKTIGLFSLDLDLGAETQKIKAIQRKLTERGYDVPIYSYGSYGGGETVEQITLMSTLRRQRPLAIVCSLRGIAPEVLGELRRYAEDGGVVACYGFLDQEATEFDCVVFDEADNTYQAARHLLELGHRDIGLYIPGARRPQEPRVKGFEQALRERGCTLRPEWIFSTPELYDSGGAAMAERFLKLKRRPTALCIVNDYAASAFIRSHLKKLEVVF
jgi:LacI family transcriptional regulator